MLRNASRRSDSGSNAWHKLALACLLHRRAIGSRTYPAQLGSCAQPLSPATSMLPTGAPGAQDTPAKGPKGPCGKERGGLPMQPRKRAGSRLDSFAFDVRQLGELQECGKEIDVRRTVGVAWGSSYCKRMPTDARPTCLVCMGCCIDFGPVRPIRKHNCQIALEAGIVLGRYANKCCNGAQHGEWARRRPNPCAESSMARVARRPRTNFGASCREKIWDGNLPAARVINRDDSQHAASPSMSHLDRAIAIDTVTN